MQSRRAFLRSTLALPAMLSGSSLLGALAGMGARAAESDGYRALVCVFLYGGMDCHDTIIPYDTASYASYADIRQSLLNAYGLLPGGSTRTRGALLPLAPATGRFGSRQFALPPQMAALHGLFEQGRAAVVANVGPLRQPTDRAAFESGSAALPPRLFSHNDQQSTWLSFAPEGSRLGWGGGFGDAMARAEANSEPTFSQISVGGNTVFLSGDLVSPYQIGTEGVPSIRLIDVARVRFPAPIGQAARDHFAAAGAVRTSLFERDFIDLSRRSLDANDFLDRALQSAGSLAAPFPQSYLGSQLRAVARTIAVRGDLGVSRQVFFVATGGFDTHSDQAANLPQLQQDLAESIAAFHTATEELGVAGGVTTFTAADFGRTLTVNGDGTDHGWGGHHFVVGGAVRGGDIYGDIPVAELGHGQDAGNGRLIPTLSVEKFAAPLGRWFGLDDAELALALPGLANFPADALAFI